MWAYNAFFPKSVENLAADQEASAGASYRIGYAIAACTISASYFFGQYATLGEVKQVGALNAAWLFALGVSWAVTGLLQTIVFYK